MTAPIVFPDVERVVTTYLRATLPDYGYPDVYVSNQRGAQATAVWVRRDGGGGLDQIREAPRLGVNVYAPTEKKCNDLAAVVSALIRSSPNGAPIVRATQNSGPSGIPEANGTRVFMTFEVIVRGADLTPTP